MKLKYLFYAHAVFAFFSGLSFIFAPAMTWNNWQVANPDSLMNLAGQNTGTMIIFVGLVALFAARVSEDNPLRNHIRLSMFILAVIGTILHAYALFSGGANFGSSYIFNLVLSLAYGYFQFIKPNA